MKRNATKHALLMSAISLLLCVSMLVGTTFAWFTDSVTSANNIIKSGNLDVEMYWADGTKAVPADGSTDWKDASEGAIFNYDNWEPGYTEVRHIKIANVGSLALKYKVSILANGEVSDLADVIDVYYADPATQVENRANLSKATKLGTLTEVLAGLGESGNGELVAGAADTITLAFKMQESAGNEYQNKAIGTNFSVILNATQLTSENDSFGPDYDANTANPTYSAPVQLPESGSPVTIGEDDFNATLPAKLVDDLREILADEEDTEYVPALSIKLAPPKVDAANKSISFEFADVVDENGNVIDLSNNDQLFTVKINVKDSFNTNDRVNVYHDGTLVEACVVDAEGYITYEVKHFCKIVVAKELVNVWDGAVDTTWYDEAENTFTLSTAAQLAGLSELAAAGNAFSGKTIVLDTDINFNGQAWTPITKFSGTFDGNGHKISNFSIDATSSRVGFFAVLSWANIKNLTLADIDATVGNRFGTLTYSVDQTNIENVTVSGVNITTTAPGSLVAGLFCAGTVNSDKIVNNCTVENITVNAQKGAALIGGIATFVQKNGTEAEGTNVFNNLHVKNFKAIVSDTDGQCAVGGIFAQTQSVWQNPKFTNCSVSGLDVTATGTVDVGGFLCYPGSYTYAVNCTVEGKIDASGVTSAKNYAGGFFGDYGWGDNVSKGDHKVTNCTADVDITTNVANAGGFVGSGINTENRNKNITFTNCEAKGTVTLVEGGTANIGGFVGYTDRGIYVNCVAAQTPFIGQVADGYTLTDDGNGTLTVAK